MPALNYAARGFDRAELVATPGWPPQKLSRAEFEKLPIDLRVRAILSKQLRFFRGDREITMREALGNND
ncbi:MAG TPA: hypothetical protein VFF06_03915 [Polyangia bacterium]|nr:hypothetical protein [Polyangia bacterium]